MSWIMSKNLSYFRNQNERKESIFDRETHQVNCDYKIQSFFSILFSIFAFILWSFDVSSG